MANLFDKAKKSPTAKAKKTTEKKEVIVKGLDKEFADIIKLKKEVDEKSAKIATIHKQILDKGRDTYLKIYDEESKNPGSFNIATPDGHKVLVVPMERYPKVTEETKELIEEVYEGEDLIEEETTFSFNNTLLNLYSDKISEAIEKLDIPEEHKEKLITATTTMNIKKGTIDSLHTLGEGNVRDNWDTLQPSMQLKGFTKE